MNVIQSILTRNVCYTANRKITVKGLMLHSVGCSQPSAQVFINQFNNPNYRRACVHAFIDANTGDIYQTLPWNHRGWHSGGSSNNTHIGVEMCEPACIKYTGGATFVCSDLAAAKASVAKTYKAAVELFAARCKEFGLNPLADGVIISHKEGYQRGIATNHGDPEHLWSQLGTGYTMDGFRKDVKAAMGGAVPSDVAKTATTTPKKTTYSLTQFVKDVQKATGAAVDGIAGKETLSKTVTVSAKVNNKHAVVKAIQKRLNALGFDCGAVDGIAGAKFTAAVINYQTANKCVADGEITAKNKTWKKLLGMA